MYEQKLIDITLLIKLKKLEIIIKWLDNDYLKDFKIKHNQNNFKTLVIKGNYAYDCYIKTIFTVFKNFQVKEIEIHTETLN